MRGRMLIIGLALVAVAIAFVASAGGDPKQPARPTATPPPAAPVPANALKLTFVYSPEKELLLAPLIKRFNAERHESGGRIVSSTPRSSRPATPRPRSPRARCARCCGRPRPRSGAGCSTTSPTAGWSPTRTRRSCARRW